MMQRLPKKGLGIVSMRLRACSLTHANVVFGSVAMELNKRPANPLQINHGPAGKALWAAVRCQNLISPFFCLKEAGNGQVTWETVHPLLRGGNN